MLRRKTKPEAPPNRDAESPPEPQTAPKPDATQEFNYDAGEDGSFTYAEAMKLIGDHEAKKKKDGPPMLHWGSVGGYSAAFELRKADGGALQFRFVDAQVEIRSPEEYEDCGYY